MGFSIELERCISPEKLRTFKDLLGTDDSEKAILAYAWNAKLSENFYFTLMNLEVAFRNAIYLAFSKKFLGADFFFLHETDARRRHTKRERHSRACWKMLCGVKHQLTTGSGTPPSDGKIIAQLTFGFWVNMTDSHYESMWRRIIREVFPHAPKSVDRAQIQAILKDIQLLRNRIYHYEPIINRFDLRQKNAEIEFLLGWISPDLLRFSCAFNEFPRLYAEGKKSLRRQMKRAVKG